MRDSASASFYYTTYALGSVTALSDSAQAKVTHSYDSWGVTTPTGAQAAANPFQYPGATKTPGAGRIEDFKIELSILVVLGDSFSTGREGRWKKMTRLMHIVLVVLAVAAVTPIAGWLGGPVQRELYS